MEDNGSKKTSITHPRLQQIIRRIQPFRWAQTRRDLRREINLRCISPKRLTSEWRLERLADFLSENQIDRALSARQASINSDAGPDADRENPFGFVQLLPRNQLRQGRGGSPLHVMRSGATSFLTVHLGGYIDQGDGTAIDSTTGLMWMRPLLGQTIGADGSVVGVPQEMTLDAAILAVATADFAGHRDWRVPTIEELETLVMTDKSVNSKMIDERAFGCENCHLWSSSPYADNPDHAWYLYVDDGHVYNNFRSTNLQVRLVRNAT